LSARLTSHSENAPASACSAPEQMTKFKWILLSALSAGLIFLIDYHSLSCEFVYDDLPDLYLNPSIHSDLKSALIYNPFRVIIYFSYWVQFQIAGEEAQAFSFRVLNLIIHWLNGLLLMRLGQMLFPQKKWLPFIAGLCFWVNPVFLEAVNFISGRFDLFATLFYLTGLCLYLCPRRSFVNSICFCLAFILALVSKEIAITLPLSALILSLFKSERPRWLLLCASALIGAVFIVLRLNWQIILAKPTIETPSWGIYFLNQNWILWFASFKTMLPFHLNFDHHLISMPIPGIIFLIINLSLLLLSFALFRKYRKSVSLALVYFVIYFPLLVIPLADPFRESRIYLSSLWLILLLSVALTRFIERRKAFGLSCFCIILICLIFLARERAQIWESGQSLWKDAVMKSPKKFRPVFNYANALRRSLELDRAKRAYVWAKTLAPDNLKVESNLYLIDQAQKHPELLEKLKSQLPE